MRNRQHRQDIHDSSEDNNCVFRGSAGDKRNQNKKEYLSGSSDKSGGLVIRHRRQKVKEDDNSNGSIYSYSANAKQRSAD